MRAVVISRARGAGGARGRRSARTRRSAPGEVRIEVRAAGINFADLMARTGHVPGRAEAARASSATRSPAIVESVGEGVESVRRRRPGRWPATRFGGHAELVTVAERDVLPLPEGLSFEQGAAVPGQLRDRLRRRSS